MNPKVKAFLVVSAKQAINAVLTSSALSGLFHSTFNLSDPTHVMNVAKAIGAVVAAREIMVWGPKLLKWTQSPTPGEES